MNPFERMKYDTPNKDKSFTSIKIKLLQKARIRNKAYMTKKFQLLHKKIEIQQLQK